MTMTHHLRLAAVVALASIGLSSCSIKEDRWPCPCWLVLVPGEDTDCEGAVTFEVRSDDASTQELCREYSFEDIFSGHYDARVRRGLKRMSIRRGIRENSIRGTLTRIPEGCESDSLWASALRIECSGEEATVPVEPAKQWATLFLKMESSGESPYPYDIRIVGSFNGLDLMTLEPHGGAFRFTPAPRGEDGSEFRARLPRQGDDSLVLELRERGAAEDTPPVETFPLGEWIAESGYDWKAENLADIYIGVDYARAGIHVSVNDWETVIELTEKI